MFNQKKTNELSFHRKKNHEIVLMSKTKSSFIKNYRFMFKQKLIAIKKYLNEHLKKKFIKFNSSKIVASMLFVKKSNDDLKFCVDYRKLNEIIEKNRYSISLINEIFNKLSKTFIFIKLNVIIAFNKIRIKKNKNE